MVVNNNARFCCYSKKKCLPQTLQIMQICKYEIKINEMENLINDDFDSSSSDNETDSNSDNETDNESGKDEFNE